MPKNVFIQLGLNNSFEYVYLAKQDFKAKALEFAASKFYCPDVLLSVNRPYTVIGIDMNPDKNAIIRRKMAHPNVHVWDYVIWHENIEDFYHGDYIAVDEYLPDGKDHAWRFKGEAITFQVLLDKIRSLPGHADAVIQGLHANIEGSEINLIHGIDWETFCPQIVRIGIHHYASVARHVNEKSPLVVKEILTANGYVFVDDKRDGDEYMTFLKKNGNTDSGEGSVSLRR